MAINKVQYGNTVLLDLTSDTVTADKLMQGYTAHDRTGALITGTATGGGGTGGVTQDQDGYLVLDDQPGSGSVTVESLSVTQNGTYTAPTGKAYSPVTVNVSGGGGLVYEEGIYEPDEDISDDWISFNGTHTQAPFYYQIWDVSETAFSINSNYFVGYNNGAQLFGGFPVSGQYGVVSIRGVGSTGSTLSGATALTTQYTDSSDTSTGNSRYWAKETGIRAYANSTSRYWKAGRTYKWIAVWTPTT